MDDDTDDLITQLCTRIGMMEDTSVTALTAGCLDQHERLAAITKMEMAAQRIDALVAAVRALLG
jgi:predicted hotdog family 3-hydroxylacyl-ACP dehydratase